MTEDLLDYWLRLIKPIFPANAWFASRFLGGDHFIQIDWNLGKDPQLQGRRSRKIEIIIKEEVIDDYLDKNKNDRALHDIKIQEWLSEKYAQFCMDQETYPSNSGSPVKWRISKDLLSN